VTQERYAQARVLLDEQQQQQQHRAVLALLAPSRLVREDLQQQPQPQRPVPSRLRQLPVGVAGLATRQAGSLTCRTGRSCAWLRIPRVGRS
jgi:hypothetical protein